jgi:NADPH:quinone reductase-like Zn-dependent oxidoreductase
MLREKTRGNLTDEEAAALPYGFCLAYHFMNRVDIKSMQNILIYGASGAIGSAAVQLAKYHGARVTGVCSTANVELVKALGADSVIDYTREDISKSAGRYDLILDTVPKGMIDRAVLKEKYRGLLSPGGRYVSINDGAAHFSRDALKLLVTLAASGLVKPVIDRCYPLEELVEAHRYVDQGHKKGNVVIRVAG